MINKRLLVKNLLAHNDENSFYDKKLQLNLGNKEGKAKFLKHICALSNSNPKNNSYIVVGIMDHDNDIVGVDFFDDAKLQNLVNAYLDNPPLVLYENIHFPQLPDGKVVGLVTIKPTKALTTLRKNIWKYYGGSVYFREGSTSAPRAFDVEIKDLNSQFVTEIEKHAQNNIELTLQGVLDFVQRHHDGLNPQYKVFKESFVVCWAGLEKKVKDKCYYSRVDIELINEHVKLFYSVYDEVEIQFDANHFRLIEYVKLGLNNVDKYYPLEQIDLYFDDNGSYQMSSVFLFEPPVFEKTVLFHIMNTQKTIAQKLLTNKALTDAQNKEVETLSPTLMLCYLNGFDEAKDLLFSIQNCLRDKNAVAYQNHKDAMRILRKIKYN